MPSSDVTVEQDNDPVVEVNADGDLQVDVFLEPEPILEVITDQANVVEFEIEPEMVLELAGEGLQGVQGAPGPAGAPGPQGPTGPPGEGDGVSVDRWYTFAEPSTVWHIEHNLGTKAYVVETFDHSKQQYEGEIVKDSLDTVEIRFYYPVAGSAHLFI